MARGRLGWTVPGRPPWSQSAWQRLHGSLCRPESCSLLWPGMHPPAQPSVGFWVSPDHHPCWKPAVPPLGLTALKSRVLPWSQGSVTFTLLPILGSRSAPLTHTIACSPTSTEAGEGRCKSCWPLAPRSPPIWCLAPYGCTALASAGLAFGPPLLWFFVKEEKPREVLLTLPLHPTFSGQVRTVHPAVCFSLFHPPSTAQGAQSQSGFSPFRPQADSSSIVLEREHLRISRERESQERDYN